MPEKNSPTLDLWSLPIDAIIDRVLSTPDGARFRSADRGALASVLAGPILVAAVLSHSGLAAKRSPRVWLIGPYPELWPDEGRWYRFIHHIGGFSGAPDVRIGTSEFHRGHGLASALSGHVASFPPLRRHAPDTDIARPFHINPSDIVIDVEFTTPLSLRAMTRRLAQVERGHYYVLADATIEWWLHRWALLECGARWHDICASVVETAIPKLRDSDIPCRHQVRQVFAGNSEISKETEEDISRAFMAYAGLVRIYRDAAPIPGNDVPKLASDGRECVRINERCFASTDGTTAYILEDGQITNPQDLGLANAWPMTAGPGDQSIEESRFRWAVQADRHLRQLAPKDVGNSDAGPTATDDDVARRELPPPLLSPLECVTPPIIRAVMAGDLDAVMALAASGRIEVTRHVDRVTPLIAAVRIGAVRIVRFLVAAGANPNAKDMHGWTPLGYAALSVNLDLCQLLQKAGASTRHRLPNGITVAELVAGATEHEQSNYVDEPASNSTQESSDRTECRLPEIQLAANSAFGSVPPRKLATRESLFSNSGFVTQPWYLEGLSPGYEFLPGPATVPKAERLNVAPGKVPSELEPTDGSAVTEHIPEIFDRAIAPLVDNSAPTTKLGSGSATSQVLSITAMLGHAGDPDSAFESAQEVARRWLTQSKRIDLQSRTEQSIHDFTPERELTVEAGHSLWAMRLDDLHDLGSAGRTWRVEAVVARIPSGTQFALRLLRIDQSGATSPQPRIVVPRLVRVLRQSLGLRDSRLPLQAKPYRVTSEPDGDLLLQHLLDPARMLPVVVVSHPLATSGSPLCDADELASELAGMAHVVMLDSEAGRALLRGLGRSLGVFGNAVRVYAPQMTLDDPIARHPRWIERFQGSDRVSTGRLMHVVARMTCERLGEDEVPTFALARAVITQQRLEVQRTRALAESLAEMPKHAPEPAPSIDVVQSDLGAESSNDAAVVHEAFTDRTTASGTAVEGAKVDESGAWQAMAFDLDSRLRALEAERSALRDERDELNVSLRFWKGEARRLSSERAHAEPEIEYPDSFADIDDWCERYLDDVVVLARARRGARDSNYEEPSLIYQGLDLLERYYIPMRIDGSDAARLAYNTRREELGLLDSPVGQAVSDHRFRDHYRVSHHGRAYTLDRHLKRSSSRNTRFQCRIYFAYDEDNGKVIVGSMPEHLPNSLTSS